MSAKEFLNNPNEKITYEAPNDDEIIQKIIELYKKIPKEQIESDEDVDDSTEPLIISASDASKGLEIGFSFLQQQEDSKKLLKNINILDRYINLKMKNAMKQTTLDKFLTNSS
ncbi:5296_t:CDS:1, partial [Cetraspora pellucida]